MSAMDNKFPNDSLIGGHSSGPRDAATDINPAGVHPATDDNKSDPNTHKEVGPSIGRSVENPYALGEKIDRLEAALDDVIALFESERATLSADGDFKKGNEGIRKFKEWKAELERIKQGKE